MTWHRCVAALAAAALAGCGGGGYGGAPLMRPPAVTAPLSTATVGGKPGFINSVNHAVYVFDADLNMPNGSACSGSCAQNWPPVTVAAGTMLPVPWTAFARADGSMQLAYKTRALYTSAFDANPGDTNGDGVDAFGGDWHVARP